MIEAELLRQVNLADDATVFLNTSLGQAIQRKANEQVEAALDKLATVKPHKTDKVREYQNDIKIAQTALGWLLELIAEGAEAEAILHEGQD